MPASALVGRRLITLDGENPSDPLAPSATLFADGGGHVASAPEYFLSRLAVSKRLASLTNSFLAAGWSVTLAKARNTVVKWPLK